MSEAQTQASEEALLGDRFIRELVKQLRAQDTHGTREGKKATARRKAPIHKTVMSNFSVTMPSGESWTPNFVETVNEE
jgi:hypothetical protein